VDKNLLGPVMLDVAGLELTEREIKKLLHPQCGGVILFARNFSSVEQVTKLIAAIRNIRPALLIAVDQEGGRVQRFRDGFLHLPPLASLGNTHDKNPDQALKDAENLGFLMATECRAVDVDFSFAPVLDIDYGNSHVIGDRAFHSDPEAISQLAAAYCRGMKQAGMAAVGKHFPGHGYVAADSHIDIPEDERDYSEIVQQDLQPFKYLVEKGIEGLMPAHVIYTACDAQPAGFSEYWLQTVLRGQLGFKGAIFSDDLSMAAAKVAGTAAERAQAALNAGCDMLLVCNDPDAADEVLESLTGMDHSHAQKRLQAMRGKQGQDWERVHESQAWLAAVDQSRRYLSA